MRGLLVNISSTDVTCEEVCVFCFKMFRLASEFMRHAEGNHRDATGRKATYMRTTCDELGRRVDSELAKSAYLSAGVDSRSKKRGWEAAGMDPGMSGTQRNGIVASGNPHINGIDLFQVLWLY